MVEKVLELLRKILLLIEELPARIRIAANQIIVTSLSEIDENLGLIKAGEFRAGNDKDPTYGFSGVRIAYPPVIYGGERYSIVGIEDDTLQFGLRHEDGIGVFAGGLATIGATSIDINTLNYIIKHTATSGDYTRIGKLMMVLPDGESVPVWAMDLSELDATATELTTNGGFELGALTNWTKTTETYGAWSIVTSPKYGGTYAAKFTPTAYGCNGVLTSDRVGATAGSAYLFNGYLYNPVQYEWAYSKIEIKWYDDASAGTLLRTDVLGTLYTYNTTGWQTYQMTRTAPTGALSFALVITVRDVV